MPHGTPAEAPGWTPERIVAARRRLRRQLTVVGVLAALGLFSLLRFKYPIVHTTSGATYEILARGYYRGSDWRGPYIQFLAHAHTRAGIAREVTDIAPVAEAYAVQNGDSVVGVLATDQYFHYGLLTFDHSYTFVLHRVPGGWEGHNLVSSPANSQLLPTSDLTHSGGAPREIVAPASPRPLARSDAGGRTPR